jgi:uncharacterized protein YyaL (SSP411 family)
LLKKSKKFVAFRERNLMANHLAGQSSPYLQQHANNPVDWYPWSDEAFERAQTENKPVFLSIGYSSCHWCHVMAHESFENQEIAAYLNEHFICIKVDREERPDVDHIYMQAVQAISGSGGWPLSVFLTPDRKPFSGGTYFPPEDRFRIPGFPKVLKAVYQAYLDRRSDLTEIGQRIEKNIQSLPDPEFKPSGAGEEILKTAFNNIADQFDGVNGGFGPAPKFPHPMTLEFLLRYYQRYKVSNALEMVEFTLGKMAASGIYDQIGGGFHRYSTDDHWLVPHFEKMLYDNALLCRVYLQAYLVTGKREYADTAEGIVNYVLKEMQSESGGFYSTLDADSEGREGKYYVWSEDQFLRSLGPVKSKVLAEYYGVSAAGNFEGKNILHRTSKGPIPEEIKMANKVLMAEREKRIKPGRDEKVLASWNGLMLRALAEAAVILERPDYLKAAVASGEFLVRNMISGSSIKHVYKDGQTSVDGFLEDYAAVAEGLLALSWASLDSRWLMPALDLSRGMVQQFKGEGDLLFDSATGQGGLFVRPRNTADGATPSGAASAAGVLFKISALTGKDEYRRIAEKNLLLEKEGCSNYPLGYSYWLADMDYYLSKSIEIVITGDSESPLTRQFADLINSKWLPNAITAVFTPGLSQVLDSMPLFAGRKLIEGKPAAYICHNYSCRASASNLVNLEKAIQEIE